MKDPRSIPPDEPLTGPIPVLSRKFALTAELDRENDPDCVRDVIRFARSVMAPVKFRYRGRVVIAYPSDTVQSIEEKVERA